MLKKIAKWVGVILCVATIIVGAVWYFSREKKPVAPATPVAEARVSPWEVLRSRIEGNEFFRCQQYDDCRGYVVRGATGDTKITGVIGSDGSLTITVMSEQDKDSPATVVYSDTNGDGNIDKVSGSNFPGAASVSKMPEGIRKEAVRKYESFVGYLTEAADKTLEQALYGAPK